MLLVIPAMVWYDTWKGIYLQLPWLLVLTSQIQIFRGGCPHMIVCYVLCQEHAGLWIHPLFFAWNHRRSIEYHNRTIVCGCSYRYGLLYICITPPYSLLFRSYWEFPQEVFMINPLVSRSFCSGPENQHVLVNGLYRTVTWSYQECHLDGCFRVYVASRFRLYMYRIVPIV